MKSWIHSVSAVVTLATFAGCVSADPSADEGSPYSAALVQDLTVAGHFCPSSGEIAGRTRSADNLYYVTTFGGGSDSQTMACFGFADGRWLYIADSWRFGCRARVKITNPRTGRWCVTQVADVGPNICVERAAGKAIIDASPAITQELFGIRSAGWSDRITVRAEVVASSTPVGCGGAATTPTPTPTPTPTGGRTCYSTTWGREMTLGACVQSRTDRVWYQCASTGWASSSLIATSRVGTVGTCTSWLPLNS
jgi:hypothetical protein